MPTRKFVFWLLVACLVGAAVGMLSMVMPLSATFVFGAVVLVVWVVSLVRVVRALLVAPKARRLYPGVPLLVGFFLFGLMTLLTTLGYFRMWMVAAIVLWGLLSSTMGLLAAQARARHQIAVNMAIGVPVILVPAVLLFVVSDVPFL